jgi:hypothetical protein
MKLFTILVLAASECIPLTSRNVLCVLPSDMLNPRSSITCNAFVSRRIECDCTLRIMLMTWQHDWVWLRCSQLFLQWVCFISHRHVCSAVSQPRSVAKWWTHLGPIPWVHEVSCSPYTLRGITAFSSSSIPATLVAYICWKLMSVFKNAVFWDVTLCGFCSNWHFGGT